MVHDLAGKLAEFYADADRGDDIERFGSLETIGANARENFEQIEPFLGMILREQFFEQMRKTVDEFMDRRRKLFQARIDAGRIRDCHGDLRLDHVYFVDGIQIIDCIEFNERFRYGDVASDLAFLITELEFRHRERLGHILVRRYAEAAQDPEVFSLLDFYKNYRALVRTKVECLRLEEGGLSPEEEREGRRNAERYYELAHRYARILSRPTLWVVCGSVAAGKTTIADELSRRLDLEVAHSDAVRKDMFGLSPRDTAVVPFGKGIYSRDATEKTYRRLRALAGESLAHRKSLILDATYGNRRYRRELIDAAERLGANLIFLECRASEATVRNRLAGRSEKNGMSDARSKHLTDIMASYEPLEELDEVRHVHVDTERPLMKVLLDAFPEVYIRHEQQSVQTVT
jgi:predicted kinase